MKINLINVNEEIKRKEKEDRSIVDQYFMPSSINQRTSEGAE